MRLKKKISSLIFLVCLCNMLLAQNFDSGSNGSDGQLNLTTPGTIIFNPASFTPPLDQDNDGVYHFTTVNVASGVTVRLANNILGIKPVIWLASGSVTIAGTVDLNGGNGHAYDGAPIAAIGGAGGYDGGVGGRPDVPGTPGLGPGGGRVPGGSAGHAQQGPSSVGGNAYGNIFLMPLFGGSGGAGGSFENTLGGAGGGAGGGALLLASSDQIVISGHIIAKGGSRGISSSTVTGSGGYGSGGSLRLIAPIISGTGSLQTAGSGAASNGRIRIEAFQHLFTGFTSGVVRFVSPGNVFPPANSPKVMITAINDVNVPAAPLGSFNPADLVINEGGPVTLSIAAENIPVNTVVDLTIWSESTGNIVIQTTPLSGTLANSTATASATFPHGFSRIYIQASWTP